MPGLLIVERSTTLSHVLKRTLTAAHLTPRGELASFAAALEHLRSQSNLGNEPYSIVVIGAPARAATDFLALIEYLRTQSETTVSVVIAHEDGADVRSWVDTLPKGQMLLWSQFARLPALVQRLSPEDGRPGRPEPAGEALRLLFVDDSRTVRLGYKRLLVRNGYLVETAESMTQALVALEQANYDLVLIDYLLPDGSGADLCRRIAVGESPPVTAMLTGSYREDIVQRCLESGASECMFKNESVELFVARVHLLTQAIELRRRLDAGRQRLDGVLGVIGEGAFGIDADSRVTFVNPAALRMFGYDDDSGLLGTDADAGLQPRIVSATDANAGLSPLRAIADPASAVNPAHPREVTATLRRKDGGEVTLEVTVIWLHGAAAKGSAACIGAVVILRDQSEYEHAENLHQALSHDKPTGLFNKRHLGELLSLEVDRRRESGGCSCLIVFAIDNYGDQTKPAEPGLLHGLADVLRQQLQSGQYPNQHAARLDGNQLALLVCDVDPEQLAALANKARLQVNELRERPGTSPSVAVTIAVTAIGRESATAESVLERAREACLRASDRGLNETEIDAGPGDSAIAQEFATLWNDRVRAAIAQERILLLARPVFPITLHHLRSGARSDAPDWVSDTLAADDNEYILDIVMRLVAPGGHILLADVFLPLVARVGLAARLERHVLARLLKQVIALRDRSGRLAFSVNLSPTTLTDPDSVTAIENGLRSAEIAPHQLILSISARHAWSASTLSQRAIARLRQIGCRFALADFGSGRGELEDVRHLPLDFIRLDPALAPVASGDASDRRILTSMIQFAHSLGLKVIGEQVDNIDVARALVSAGIDHACGAWIGTPALLRRIDLAAMFPVEETRSAVS